MGKEETKLQGEIIKALNQFPGCVAHRHNVYKPGYKKKIRTPKDQIGIGDIICCYRGNYLEFEVKTKTGIQEESQKEREIIVKRAAGRYYIVKSVQEVIEIILGFYNKA